MKNLVMCKCGICQDDCEYHKIEIDFSDLMGEAIRLQKEINTVWANIVFHTNGTVLAIDPGTENENE